MTIKFFLKVRDMKAGVGQTIVKVIIAVLSAVAGALGWNIVA